MYLKTEFNYKKYHNRKYVFENQEKLQFKIFIFIEAYIL